MYRSKGNSKKLDSEEEHAATDAEQDDTVIDAQYFDSLSGTGNSLLLLPASSIILENSRQNCLDAADICRNFLQQAIISETNPATMSLVEYIEAAVPNGEMGYGQEYQSGKLAANTSNHFRFH